MVDDGTWEMGVAIDARGCGSSNVAVGVLAGATQWRCGVVRGRPGVGVARRGGGRGNHGTRTYAQLAQHSGFLALGIEAFA